MTKETKLETTKGQPQRLAPAPCSATCCDCEEAIAATDRFCKHCGGEQGLIRWDWKEQPCWGSINAKLKPFGVQIQDVETGSDEYAVRVVGSQNATLSHEEGGKEKL